MPRPIELVLKEATYGSSTFGRCYKRKGPGTVAAGGLDAKLHRPFLYRESRHVRALRFGVPRIDLEGLLVFRKSQPALTPAAVVYYGGLFKKHMTPRKLS